MTTEYERGGRSRATCPKSWPGPLTNAWGSSSPNPTRPRRPAAARRSAKALEADHLDAAASLREGLDDMFAVRRIGVGGTLAATLTTTYCIESMISIAKRATRRVTKWNDGSMTKR